MYESATLAESSQDRTTPSPCLIPWFASLVWVQLGLVCCLTAMFVILVLLLHWALPEKKRNGSLTYKTSARDFESRNVRPPAAYPKRSSPSFHGSFPRRPPSPTFRPSPRLIPLPPGPPPRQLPASPMPPPHHSPDRRILHRGSPFSPSPRRPLKDALAKSKVSDNPVYFSPPPADRVLSSPATRSHLPVAFSEFPITTTTLDVPSSTGHNNALTTNTTTSTTTSHFPPITTNTLTTTTTTSNNTKVSDTNDLLPSFSLQSSTAPGFMPVQTTSQIPHPSTSSLTRRSHEKDNSALKSAVTLSGTSSNGKDFNVSSASPEDNGSSSLSNLKSRIREMLSKVKEIDARVVQRDEVSVMRLPMKSKESV